MCAAGLVSRGSVVSSRGNRLRAWKPARRSSESTVRRASGWTTCAGPLTSTRFAANSTKRDDDEEHEPRLESARGRAVGLSRDPVDEAGHRPTICADGDHVGEPAHTEQNGSASLAKRRKQATVAVYSTIGKLTILERDERLGELDLVLHRNTPRDIGRRTRRRRQAGAALHARGGASCSCEWVQPDAIRSRERQRNLTRPGALSSICSSRTSIPGARARCDRSARSRWPAADRQPSTLTPAARRTASAVPSATRDASRAARCTSRAWIAAALSRPWRPRRQLLGDQRPRRVSTYQAPASREQDADRHGVVVGRPGRLGPRRWRQVGDRRRVTFGRTQQRSRPKPFVLEPG